MCKIECRVLALVPAQAPQRPRALAHSTRLLLLALLVQLVPSNRVEQQRSPRISLPIKFGRSLHCEATAIPRARWVTHLALTSRCSDLTSDHASLSTSSSLDGQADRKDNTSTMLDSTECPSAVFRTHLEHGKNALVEGRSMRTSSVLTSMSDVCM